MKKRLRELTSGVYGVDSIINKVKKNSSDEENKKDDEEKENDEDKDSRKSKKMNNDDSPSVFDLGKKSSNSDKAEEFQKRKKKTKKKKKSKENKNTKSSKRKNNKKKKKKTDSGKDNSKNYIEIKKEKEEKNKGRKKDKSSKSREKKDSGGEDGSGENMDEHLETVLSERKADIIVIGSGGGGNNTINRMNEVGIQGVELVAVNTDAQDLLTTNADSKLLIGEDLTNGLGAGSIPKVGEEAARESRKDIKDKLSGSDMVFITCGLGGGTGTGSVPVMAEISKKLGILTVGIVTLPFEMEGERRQKNALSGLEKLKDEVDTLIVIPNDKLLELAPNLPLHSAFKVADEILTNAVKGVSELITKAGLVNMDFADVKAVMGDGGLSLVGIGESDSENKASEAVEKAIQNPLLDIDIGGATGMLVNVSGGEEMTLEEARKVVETVSVRLEDDARIIWGAQIDKSLEDKIKAMLIVTGIQEDTITGINDYEEESVEDEIEDELGIEFVEDEGETEF